MAIPVYLQQFKAAGVYRVVFDKSTIENVNTETLRLVVGYSEKGPFNIPVYVKNPQEFTTLFGGISKKLEKRGIYFHRLALQMLNMHPVICLNLKHFDGERLNGSTICTDFNPIFNPIDTVELRVEDIYDTTRFWELSADKLIDLRACDGTLMNQYINLSITDTKNNSMSYFIRKASGTKVSQYNITVNDWYSDNADEMPEYLIGQENNLISDYFAEIYVFKGKFNAKQVLASDSLKNYFVATNEVDDDGEVIIKLRDHVINGFGDAVDTLDTLYMDETSNAVGHWIGSLIPYFKDKQGNYRSLDIVFNQDNEEHKMMMAFNIDMLEDMAANIDLSGRLRIPTETAIKRGLIRGNTFDLNQIYEGIGETTLLGNVDAPVVADVMHFSSNVLEIFKGSQLALQDLRGGMSKITGALYVSAIDKDENVIILTQLGTDESDYNVAIQNGEFSSSDDASDDGRGTVKVMCNDEIQLYDFAQRLGVQFDSENNPISGAGTCWLFNDEEDAYGAFENPEDPMAGPVRIVTAISRIEKEDKTRYRDIDVDLKASFVDVSVLTQTVTTGKNKTVDNSVYGPSVTFIDNTGWEYGDFDLNGVMTTGLYSKDTYNTTLSSVLHPGECLLAADGSTTNSDIDNYYDNVYVNEVGVTKDGINYILLSGEPLCDWSYIGNADGDQSTDLSASSLGDEVGKEYLIRIDAPLNQEIGTMIPTYLQGYTFKNDKPQGTDMLAKVKWQESILSTLTDYKGLRLGLLNKSEIDYRYVIDTFESYPVANLKEILAFLCKEKQSAFCISNFPAIKTFVKCPYTSFTDANGIFDANYIVKGYNRKKAAGIRFSLPDEVNGASFIAFYTPLKFSDGYVDLTIPSAGLVSNLFMQKYLSRQPYYIVAGPNYGAISAPGLVGPDYKFSIEELNLLEPYGVNCMVYRPTFGTFINANQTAKQTPVSALSKVNVRELVIYLQDEIEKVLQAYQWEFNNPTTRNAILDRANQICALVAANGGIQAYHNIMDESNNTPEIIDNEMAILSTAIEPGMGCGKMIQELTLYRTGQLSSSIIE